MLRARSIPAALALALVAPLAASLLASCQSGGATVLLEGETPALENRSYAWVDERIEKPADSAPVVDEEVEAEVRLLIDERLAARGFRQADEDDAGFLLTLRLDATLDTRQHDPYFAIYALEQFERGHLTLAALAPVSYQPFWIARSNIVLRATKRSMTRDTVTWIEVDEEREWDVPRLVKSVMETLPRHDD